MKPVDYGARPPTPRYALPDGSYPSPNIDDLIIVQEVNLPVIQQRALAYGTPHRTDTTAKLVFQEELEGDIHNIRVRLTYARDRVAQDAHNYRISYSGDDTTYPVFTRTYLERRDSYTPGTDLQALGVVYKLKLTAGGTGYASTTTVSASGGAGSGFAASVEVQAGVIVAIRITNCGTGYTSAPTISFSGGGSGATATATIQPVTCFLVDEQSEPAPSPLGNLYLMVTRVYETLPGPWTSRVSIEPETQLRIDNLERRIKATAASTFVLGSGLTVTIPSGTVSGEVIDWGRTPLSRTIEREEAVVMDADIDGWTRTEQRSIGFQFPATFIFLLGWDIPALSPFVKTGPFPGVSYFLTPHVNASKPAEVTYSYSIGPSGTVPDTWQVVTPGAGSRELPIPANCIHNDYTLIEDRGGGTTQIIEDTPASTPDTYTAGVTEPIVQASEERWKGPVYRKVVITVVEPANSDRNV
jgi:hypothetical protein